MFKNVYKKKVAEEKGFEPLIRFTSYDELATRWFKPLTHSSLSTCYHERKIWVN